MARTILYMWTVLTHKAVLSDQLQGQLVRQHRGVAMGDVGEGPGMDKHWCALKQTWGHSKLGKGAKWQQFTQKARPMFTLLNTLKTFMLTYLKDSGWLLKYK